MKITVNIDGEAVEVALSELAAVLNPTSMLEIMGFGADAFIEAIKNAAPKDTGALAASVTKSITGVLGWAIGPDTDAIPYAFIQNFGGDIYPKNGGFLRFQIGGEVIFARHVHIPGTHYMDTAFSEGEGAALAIVMAALEAAASAE